MNESKQGKITEAQPHCVIIQLFDSPIELVYKQCLCLGWKANEEYKTVDGGMTTCQLTLGTILSPVTAACPSRQAARNRDAHWALDKLSSLAESFK